MLLGVPGSPSACWSAACVLVGVLGLAAAAHGRHRGARAPPTAVAELVDAGRAARPAAGRRRRVQVQVVDAAGPGARGLDRRRPAGADAVRRPSCAPRPTGEGRYIAGDRLGVDGPVRVVAVTPAGRRPGTVLVARSIADVHAERARCCATTLLVAFPLLVSLLARGGLAGGRRGAAAGRGAARRAPRRSPAAPRPGRLPVPDVARRDPPAGGDPQRHARPAGRRPGPGSGRSSPTPRTSCAARWPTCAPSWRWRSGSADRTDWPALADDLLADVERLSRLVDDLLLLARADDAGAPGAAAPTGPVELGELLAAVAGALPGGVGRRRRADGPLWTVGDADALAPGGGQPAGQRGAARPLAGAAVGGGRRRRTA